MVIKKKLCVDQSSMIFSETFSCIDEEVESAISSDLAQTPTWVNYVSAGLGPWAKC